jgi:metal-sulfur cluster biosynthetic enzyme
MKTINTLVIAAEVIEALRTCFDPEIPVGNLKFQGRRDLRED